MSFLNTIKAFFSSPKADPAVFAATKAFMVAGDSFGSALTAIGVHTGLAKYRQSIWKWQMNYSDPDAYTEVELDAHTAAMRTLNAAFDNLTDAFIALGSGERLPSVDEFYKLNCDAYKIVASAYSKAARLACGSAVNQSVQAAKDAITLGILELSAANPRNPRNVNPAAAKANLAAFKANAVSKSKADTFNQKAEAAEAMAKVILAKAEGVVAAAIEQSNQNAKENENDPRITAHSRRMVQQDEASGGES